MKNKVYYGSIVLLIAIVGLTAVASRARTVQDNSEEFANAVLTLTPGQTLRITVANQLPSGADGRKYKMLVAAIILDAEGRVIANAGEITLGPGEFHSFNFNRADLPGAGPLRLRAEIHQRTFPGFAGGVSVASADVDGVIETIDNLTGQTQAATGLRRDIDLAGSNDLVQTQSSLLGLAYGQTLRVHVAQTSRGSRTGILRARITLNDGDGNVIAQSSELSIAPGKFDSYEFPRNALPLTGDLNTGRVQMAANVFLKFGDKRGEASVSLELLDETTGRTIGLPLPAVQKVRVINKCPDCEPPF